MTLCMTLSAKIDRYRRKGATDACIRPLKEKHQFVQSSEKVMAPGLCTGGSFLKFMPVLRKALASL